MHKLNKKAVEDNMKVCFVAINAKYIHTAPGVRILNKIVSKKYESCFFEFTIKDKVDNIVEKIKDYDIIGLSCYIWNIEIMIELSKKIKSLYPNKIIFSGGPEVGYDTKSFVSAFDYIISGEGEEVIIPFIDAIVNQKEMPDGIASIDRPFVKPLFVKDLNNVPSIIDTYTEEDRKNRIIYFETTRGCPFNCSYCLSSLEKGVRFFSEEYVKEVFDFILNNEFKCVKFLDRTFNINSKKFLDICKLLEKTNNTYQFEIEAQLFNDEIIDYFTNVVTSNKFRLEIGIQSLMDEAINAVDRKQDNKKILEIINTINKAGRVVIHVDLIAGLPYETLNDFKTTFNKTFLLLCDELQLGFLKLLRGTKIRNESYLYDYKFTKCAPYEVLSNKFLTEQEMDIIHQCENGLEWLWNHKRAYNLMNHLIKDKVIDNYFDFFYQFNKYYDKTKQLYENYESLCHYLKDINLYKDEYIDDLKLDYLSNLKIKPKPFWEIKDSLENYRKLLGYQNTNFYITPYYNKYLVIKYEKGKQPILVIE